MAVTEEELRLILAVKDRMSRTINRNTKALKAMVGIAKGVGLVFAAWRLAKTAMAIGQMGAEVERLNISFRRLSGAAPDEMLERLRRSTRGTISDMDLMLNANRMMMLGVTKDAKTMARLAEIAIARGQALGLTAQTSLDRMATGLGRVSTKILDDIGILTGGQKTFDDYAAIIGKTADALTDQEKRQALVNMVLKDTITLTDDAASSAEKAAARFENLKRALAVRYAKQYGEFMEQLAARIETTTKLASGMAEIRMDFSHWTPYVVEIIAGYGELNLALEISNPLLREHMGLIDALPSSYDQAVDALTGLVDNLRALGWKTLAERRMGGTPWQWISVDDIEEAQRLYGMDLANAQWYLSEMAYMRKDAAAAQDELDRDAVRQAEAHGRELLRARKQALGELRSTVEQLLQPTAVTDLDMARSRLGKYTDKWDEYIRRIRSAATDAESAWKHLIPTDILAGGADAIKVWAAETEEAFYAGLIPEEIDWAAFESAYRRFVTEKAGRERMIEEAMRRVGAMRVDIEAFLGIAPDAAGAMEAIAATKGPIETIRDTLPTFKSNLDKAGGAASALGISSGPLDIMKSLLDDVNEKLAQFEDALEKGRAAAEPPPPPTEPVTTDETITTGVGGGASMHGRTVVFAAGSVVVTGTGGPGATRRDTETGMLAALRAAGMPI